jgi:hypothetical protein
MIFLIIFPKKIKLKSFYLIIKYFRIIKISIYYLLINQYYIYMYIFKKIRKQKNILLISLLLLLIYEMFKNRS